MRFANYKPIKTFIIQPQPEPTILLDRCDKTPFKIFHTSPFHRPFVVFTICAVKSFLTRSWISKRFTVRSESSPLSKDVSDETGKDLDITRKLNTFMLVTSSSTQMVKASTLQANWTRSESAKVQKIIQRKPFRINYLLGFTIGDVLINIVTNRWYYRRVRLFILKRSLVWYYKSNKSHCRRQPNPLHAQLHNALISLYPIFNGVCNRWLIVWNYFSYGRAFFNSKTCNGTAVSTCTLLNGWKRISISS